MGWGILFCGYMFLLSIPLHAVGICAELIGYILMFRACRQLSQYQKEFKVAGIVCCVLMPFGVYSFVLQCFSWLHMDALYERCNELIAPVYSILLGALLLVFHMFLLTGIRHLAHEVDLPDIVRQAMRNRIMTVVYFVLIVSVNFLNIPAVTQYVSYVSLTAIVSLFGFVWMMLNAKMLFQCYMRICLPEDVDMPERDSRFANPFSRRKGDTDDKKTQDDDYARRKAEYNEAMRERQERRTKRAKRGKR